MSLTLRGQREQVKGSSWRGGGTTAWKRGGRPWGQVPAPETAAPGPRLLAQLCPFSGSFFKYHKAGTSYTHLTGAENQARRG